MSGTGWSGKVGFHLGKSLAGGMKSKGAAAIYKANAVAAKAQFLAEHGVVMKGTAYMQPFVKGVAPKVITSGVVKSAASVGAKPILVKVAIGVGKVVITGLVGIVSALVASSNG